MRILLVGAELEENLATRYLASALQAAGHGAVIVAFGSPSDAAGVGRAVRDCRPDLVGLSMTFQRRAHEFGELAGTLRRDGFAGHITCGGHFPTFAWRELLDRFAALDSAVRHEGEQTIVELCAALEHPEPELSSIRGLAFRTRDGAVVATAPRPLQTDLDGMPFPARVGEPQMHLGIPTAFLVGSRGCYGHCAFCCIHAFIREAGGPKYRARSAASVADEVAELRRTRGARMFVFHDDDFFTRDRARDLERVKSLRDELWRRNVRDVAFVVKARPDDVDAEVFGVLKQIGLLRIYLGIEAGCSQGLRTLGRGVDLETNRRALSVVRELEVYTCYNMLIFDPDSTTQSLRTSLGFVRENSDIPMNFCRTEVYVGTPLMKRLEREGRLIGDVFGWDYEISDPAAERTLRVFASAFHERNFRADGLMNANLGLGYNLQLLKQFYPHGVTPSLCERTVSTIRAVNDDCVDRMLRIIGFCESPRSCEPEALEEFTALITSETERANAQLEERVIAATDGVICAARQRRVAAPMWRSVAAATLALTPLACPSRQGQVESLPPPDPPPPPTVYVIEPDGGPCGGFATPPPDETSYPPPDPPPPPTTYLPPDPPPPPVTNNPPPDPPPPPTTGRRRYPPPPDPLPPPRRDAGRKPPPPPDPLPGPWTAAPLGPDDDD